jgi:hypothetical protein
MTIDKITSADDEFIKRSEAASARSWAWLTASFAAQFGRGISVCVTRNGDQVSVHAFSSIFNSTTEMCLSLGYLESLHDVLQHAKPAALGIAEWVVFNRREESEAVKAQMRRGIAEMLELGIFFAAEEYFADRRAKPKEEPDGPQTPTPQNAV